MNYVLNHIDQQGKRMMGVRFRGGAVEAVYLTVFCRYLGIGSLHQGNACSSLDFFRLQDNETTLWRENWKEYQLGPRHHNTGQHRSTPTAKDKSWRATFDSCPMLRRFLELNSHWGLNKPLLSTACHFPLPGNRER